MTKKENHVKRIKFCYINDDDDENLTVSDKMRKKTTKSGTFS